MRQLPLYLWKWLLFGGNENNKSDCRNNIAMFPRETQALPSGPVTIAVVQTTPNLQQQHLILPTYSVGQKSRKGRLVSGQHMPGLSTGKTWSLGVTWQLEIGILWSSLTHMSGGGCWPLARISAGAVGCKTCTRSLHVAAWASKRKVPGFLESASQERQDTVLPFMI